MDDDGHFSLNPKIWRKKKKKKKEKKPNFQWIIPTLATLKNILEKNTR
jgi:hypothetical protein